MVYDFLQTENDAVFANIIMCVAIIYKVRYYCGQWGETKTESGTFPLFDGGRKAIQHKK